MTEDGKLFNEAEESKYLNESTAVLFLTVILTEAEGSYAVVVIVCYIRSFDPAALRSG